MIRLRRRKYSVLNKSLDTFVFCTVLLVKFGNSTLLFTLEFTLFTLEPKQTGEIKKKSDVLT